MTYTSNPANNVQPDTHGGQISDAELNALWASKWTPQPVKPDIAELSAQLFNWPANYEQKPMTAGEAHQRYAGGIKAMAADWYPACTDPASPCKSGLLPCPSPDACRKPAGEAREERVASVWFWGVVAVGAVVLGYLVSGGAVQLVGWVRGLL